MAKHFLSFIFILVSTLCFAQRNQNMSTLTKEEVAQKRHEDSMQRVRNEFEQNFSTDAYFKKLRDIKLKNDTIQLNATLEFLTNIEPQADTMTSLTIQSSALSVFPQSMKNFKQLKSLTLRRCQSVYLEDLFEKLKDINTLTEVNIIFSEKAKLPDNIGLLKHVKILNLNGNKLNELPVGMKNMSSLETINLHNNINLNIEQVWDVLSQVKSLKNVIISGNRLYHLGDNIGKMTQITSLDAKMNLLEEVTSSVEEMTSLKSINLSGNTKLNTITGFTSLSKIISLERLDFENNGLKEIPASIGTLTQLKVLNMVNNPLTKIHGLIGNLTKLEELYIGIGVNSKERVPLKTLPSELSSCTELKVLNAKQCNLENIPSSFSSLKNLVTVDLSWNQLNSFPSFLKSAANLNYLDISYNKINEFPTDIGSMGLNIETFLFASNFYGPYKEKVNKIPLSILRFKKLKTLSLQDQVFETLPDNFWTELSQMETLNLMGALLQEVPDQIDKMPNLKSLNLKANEIKRVSPNLANLKKLEYLNLSYNTDLFSSASELFEIIKTMSKLKTFEISYINIPKELTNALANQMPNTKIIKYELKESSEYEKPDKK